MNKTSLINEPPSFFCFVLFFVYFFEVMLLIFQFKSIFQRNEKRFINLVLKAKQQTEI